MTHDEFEAWADGKSDDVHAWVSTHFRHDADGTDYVAREFRTTEQWLIFLQGGGFLDQFSEKPLQSADLRSLDADTPEGFYVFLRHKKDGHTCEPFEGMMIDPVNQTMSWC